ncbi:MAG: Hsp20/alpha crystallin family protein [Candidatus Gastranaerophilales bacterium]|nr:Hsp20/alpha crystallin family protein [Candidatus Gastranaerophilales bacterium]
MNHHELIIREPDLYFDSIHHELNNFLRDTVLGPAFSNPLNVKKNSVWRPSVEVKQNEKEYKVKVQLPGVKKEDIEVTLDNDFMTVTAEIEEEKEEKEEKEKNAKYHTCEFRYGKYQRTISFDQPIKANDSKAEYRNGVLRVIIPKQHIEETKAKRLEIH